MPNKGRVLALLSGLALFGGTPLTGGTQETGVFDDYILFGQSAAFSGEAQELGKDMRLGIEAAFREAQANGGVHGREIKLLSLDDAYEPEAAIVNTRKLIEEEDVFALIGAVGTPTSRSAVPVAAAAKVPYIAPFTGAEILRDPKWNNVMNLRASYYQETEAMVRYLTQELDIKRVSVLYQDDSFGLAGYNGVIRALTKRGMEAVAVAVYPRNTRAVKTGLLKLRRAAPEAVIMIGSYRPVAEFIAWSRQLEFNPVFMTLSFVGGNALVQLLGDKGIGVFVTQVVPFPKRDDLPVLKQYRAALAAVAPDAPPGFVSLEGYLAGRLTVAALERAGPQPDRENFVEAIRSIKQMDLGGFTLSFDGNNQGSNKVFLTIISEGGQYSPMADPDQWGKP
ncbi:MAG: ABC transporter substrate-binding protein [Gammaproteobacteria bacterium]